MSNISVFILYDNLNQIWHQELRDMLKKDFDIEYFIDFMEASQVIDKFKQA